jgi:hypothetical protein
MVFALLSALLVQTPGAPAPPTPPPPACAALDQGLPANLGSWNDHVAVSGFRVGEAANVPTNRPLTFEVSEAGTYGLALSLGAWIDVARGGLALHASNNGRGPACSTIRKIVDFRLEPGTYTVTVSRTAESSARLLIFRR